MLQLYLVFRHIFLTFIPFCFILPYRLYVVVQQLSHAQHFVTPWTVAHQVPVSMGFPRQEYWSGLLFPSPVDLPDPKVEPASSAQQVNSSPLSHQGSPQVIQESISQFPNTEGLSRELSIMNFQFNFIVVKQHTFHDLNNFEFFDGSEYDTTWSMLLRRMCVGWCALQTSLRSRQLRVSFKSSTIFLIFYLFYQLLREGH